MRILLLIIAVLSSTLLLGQSTDSPVGRWATIDDETGEKRSLVEITATGKTFTGKIVEILTENKKALCTKCSGDQKNAPILGLTIVSNLVAEGDYWGDGTILDPTKGKTYGLSIWYEDNNPDVLFVRGKHWTGLYRTQTWQRQ